MSSKSLNELAADTALVLRARAHALRLAGDLAAMGKLCEPEGDLDTDRVLLKATAAQVAAALTPRGEVGRLTSSPERRCTAGRPAFWIVALVRLRRAWFTNDKDEPVRSKSGESKALGLSELPTWGFYKRWRNSLLRSAVGTNRSSGLRDDDYLRVARSSLNAVVTFESRFEPYSTTITASSSLGQLDDMAVR